MSTNTKYWEHSAPTGGSPAWATITFYKNMALGLGLVRVAGNSTAPSTGSVDVTIPSGYLPNVNYFCELTQDAGRVEIRSDGALRFNLTGSKWGACNFTYLLA
jgi:hypothetical protein